MNAPFWALPLSIRVLSALAVLFCVAMPVAAISVQPQPPVETPPDVGVPPAGHGDVDTPCGGPDCQAPSKPVVALLLPLTGPFAQLGQSVQTAVTAALSANDSVQLRLFDTQGTGAGARRATADALDGRPAFIAGGLGDRETREIWTQVSRAGIPFITMGRSRLTGSGAVQTVATRELIAKSLISSLGTRPPECAMIIRRDDAFGDAENASFRSVLVGRSIPVIASVVMPRPGATAETGAAAKTSGSEGDFAAEVTDAARAFIATRPCSNLLLHLVVDITTARRLVDYLRFAGFFDLPDVSVTMTGTALFDAPGMIAQSGASLKGLSFVAVDVESAFGERRDDPFKGEVDDFAAFVAAVAGGMSGLSAAGGPVVPDGMAIQGRTGTLMWRAGSVVGHRLKQCRVTGRGIECSPMESEAPPSGADSTAGGNP